LIVLTTPAITQTLQPRSPQTEQKVPGLDLNTNRINAVHRLYPALDGEGLTVSVKENQYDTTDIDLRLRHRPSGRGSGFSTTHAGLMATLIAGAGNSYHTGRGVARAAELATADFINLLPDGRDHYESLGVSVQNHSYGVGIENFYGPDAAAYDASVRELPYLVHVFSAGNQGQTTADHGRYAGITGYANLTGSFKMAKNVLTVGALENTRLISEQVSKGPAYDGRLKPDLAAAGQDGSSGAAALVSGAGLLLQQAYLEKQGELPPASLIRALLLNSTEDIGPPGIDYQSGFGNLNALKAVETLLADQSYLGILEIGEMDSQPIVVPPGIDEIKITLAWTDPPADSTAAKALINDLDLELRHAETGQTWRPWVLSTFPHPDSLAQPPRRDRDTLNNHEQISLQMPLPGTYILEISGEWIVEGPQAFALAWSLDTLDHFQWTNPAPGDHLEAGETVNLCWDTNMRNEQAALEYTLDEGKNWRLLADQINLMDQYWLWPTPDTFALAQLRLVTSQDTFPSPPFHLYRDLNLRVGYNCETSLFLYWDRLEHAGAYIVYALDERYLEPMAIVQDTFLEVDKTVDTPLHYAVGPQLSNVPENLRGPTINYTFQGVGCYIRNLLARTVGEGRASLELELGTLYNVRQITFERKIDGQFVALESRAPNGALTYTYLDREMQKGLNTYRASLELQSGEVLYSDESGLYYVPAQTYLVFPNPVRDGQALQILSSDSAAAGSLLYLFDGLGRQVGVLPLETPSEFLELDYLPEGLYFYQIRREDRQLQAGKIIVSR
jgi:hypothetical protein